LSDIRYGWCPREYTVPDEPKYAWLAQYPAGRSITELEIQYGALRDANSHCYFYFRDPSFQRNIPEEHRAQFLSESTDASEKIENLKRTIIASGKPVYKYRCQWGGLYDNKPMVRGLENFRQRVLEDLWSGISSTFPEDNSPIDPISTERFYHLNFLEFHSRKFVPRKELDDLKKAVDLHNVVVLAGQGI
jgi:telomerase protein component 1